MLRTMRDDGHPDYEVDAPKADRENFLKRADGCRHGRSEVRRHRIRGEGNQAADAREGKA
jgi:hypothetical protein